MFFIKRHLTLHPNDFTHITKDYFVFELTDSETETKKKRMKEKANDSWLKSKSNYGIAFGSVD